jgi:hypothetical protein
MPFKKVATGANRGKYKSPSGRIFTKRQVNLYHATKGFSRPPRKSRGK